MTPEVQAFVADAKSVDLMSALVAGGGSTARLKRSGSEWVGPCPVCGGRDRFGLNESKQVFNCRGAEGGDGIALVRHLTGVDFREACEIINGADWPEAGASPEERALRRREAEARIAEQRRKAEADAIAAAARDNTYREDEWRRCLNIWRASAPLAEGEGALAYLAARGLDGSQVDPAYLRTHPALDFVEDKVTLHRGPAMVALFVRIDSVGYVPVGIHRTWLALDAAPKFRPMLLDKAGEPLPTKKMRGSKMGGLIPVVGRLSRARRMVAGEGIETVLGFGAFDGFRPDTFYCAAGDLGNLCGKAVDRLRHPSAIKRDKAGRRSAVLVPGFEPDFSSLAMPVPDHIEELVLLGDGDSEPFFTRAALRRGAARHARPGRTVRALFAPAGSDWGEFRMETAA